MINSLSNLTPNVVPPANASTAKASSKGQIADSASTFVSQFLASCGHQPAGGSNSNSESLMSMLDASNPSV